MVGPKNQDFWPKNNILKGNHCILRIRGVQVENKVVQKLTLKVQFWHFLINQHSLKELFSIFFHEFVDPPSFKFHNRTDIRLSRCYQLSYFFVYLECCKKCH